MSTESWIDAVSAARRALPIPARNLRDEAAEGGCGVIGLAASVPVDGKHLLRSLTQMRNRGNGKGGGIAAVGLDAAWLGVDPALLESHVLLAVAYLDADARAEVERDHVHADYDVAHLHEVATLPDYTAIEGLEVRPPDVVLYLVRPKADRLVDFASGFAAPHGASPSAREIEDEYVFQSTFRLNVEHYAGERGNRAFVLSHGRNLLVLKMVGYADDVIRWYRLEELGAHVWIGHHRYPTKGRVWHPGGAHPFIGVNEALVHNGDFANYAAVCDYLAQRGLRPLFQTDTEVSAQVFDLHLRLYGYPLEYVIESLAPTTERDFTMLPEHKQRLYEALQATHIHGSPDGPWFFIIAQSLNEAWRLIGITDTSMLRPQVFALQEGEAQIAFAASEKQVIDACLESLSAEDPRFWPRADRYWNARGGSHTDGGAFAFSVEPDATSPSGRRLVCADKFGNPVTLPADMPAALAQGAGGGMGNGAANGAGEGSGSLVAGGGGSVAHAASNGNGNGTGSAPAYANGSTAPNERTIAGLPAASYSALQTALDGLVADAASGRPDARSAAILAISRVINGSHTTGALRRSSVRTMADEALAAVFDATRTAPCDAYRGFNKADLAPNGVPESGQVPAPTDEAQTAVVDARDFDVEGDVSLARAVVWLHRAGWRRLLLHSCRGHRFIGSGLGSETTDLHIDVYGSSGDYLGSGIDGAVIVVHGSAQDQLAQIQKRGELVVHGDVGQAFLYGAKGGRAYVLGNAAGRPLINAVGRPRVVINGTALDYLAESFMAGDPLRDGGFVVLNGMRWDETAGWLSLDTPYPGGNLFSLASGGAIYVRDPHHRLGEDQLNGGDFARLTDADWAVVEPLLQENERHFGLTLARLLTVDGQARRPADVYRKIQPAKNKALQAEEAWVASAEVEPEGV